MGREVRRVPANWVHPFYSESEINERPHLRGRHKPLFDGFRTAVTSWEEEKKAWNIGLRKDFMTDEYVPINGDYTFEDWVGEKPEKEDYMPEFTYGTCTNYMMYETTSEGTPISPAFDTPQKLARWLADTNASAFGSSGASYDSWIDMILGHGYAISCVVTSDGIVDGVTASSMFDKENAQ